MKTRSSPAILGLLLGSLLGLSACAWWSKPVDPAKPEGPTTGDQVTGTIGEIAAFLPPPYNALAVLLLSGAGIFAGYKQGKKIERKAVITRMAAGQPPIS